MDESLVFQKVGIAVGLGLLVGRQRERARSPVAGIRTFGLITVLGAVSALLGRSFGGWVVGLGPMATLLVSATWLRCGRRGFTGRGCQPFRCEPGAAAIQLISPPEGQRRALKVRRRVGPRRARTRSCVAACGRLHYQGSRNPVE